MKKVIVMSVRPEWLAKILNGEKTVEIRTRVPKDFVGEIHLACTSPFNIKYDKSHKRNDYLYNDDYNSKHIIGDYWLGMTRTRLNGKVVAKIDYNYKNVKRISYDTIEDYAGDMEDVCIKERVYERIVNNACLDYEHMSKYSKCKPLFAIPLTNLAIFNKPRELGKYYSQKDYYKASLTRCPQSYQFAYVEEE
jgi:hypothetical protein